MAKNRAIFAVCLIFVACSEVVMFLRGYMIFDFSKPIRRYYMYSYVILFLVCILALPSVFLVKESDGKSLKRMGVVLYGFSFFIIAWSVLISYLDLRGGGIPIVYLTIIMTIGCIMVLHPSIFLLYMIFSFSALVFLCRQSQYRVLSGGGDTWNVVIFLLMSYLVSLRQYEVIAKEEKIHSQLEKLNLTDTLTGLENETSYYHLQDELNERSLSDEDLTYAVVMMDLNNVKATNDKWGHRFGCHLIVTVGKILPEVFPSSRLFHIGGDEFVAIVIDEDYREMKSRLKNLEKRLQFSSTTLEDKEMVLSLAYGLAIYEKGQDFKVVMQKADDEMYANKKVLKEKFGLTR